MKTVSKSITGALGAVLLTTALAAPAEAQRYRRYDRRGDGISLGDVVLGTIVVGGVAAAIGALGNQDRYGRRTDDRRYNTRGYGDDRGSDRRSSVETCAYEAEQEAGRRYGGGGSVRNIDDVDRDGRDGYRVRGTVEVQPDYRYGRDGYGRDRYYDGRGSNIVRFSCSARYGRVTGLSIGSNYANGY